jgi:PAS domain S-box-containing protein
VGVALIRTATGEYIRVNKRLGEIVGYSVDELQSITYMDITHPDDYQHDEDNQERLLKGEVRDLNVTKRYLHKDGSIIWVNINASRLWGDEDDPDQHITIVEDITERIKVEQALRESEERLQRITDNAPDIIYRYRIQPDHGFEFISQAVTNITGYTPEEFMENQDLGPKIIHPDDQTNLLDFLQGEIPKNPHAARWYRKDGTMIWIEDIQTPIYDEDGNLIAFEGVARDITDRKQVEQELHQLVNQQEALRQASLKLTSNLALESVLVSILEQAMQLITADDAHIFLYEEGVIHFGAVKWMDGRQDTPFAEPRQNGLTYTVAQSGKRIAIRDMSDHELFKDWPLEGAIVGLPLKIGDQVVGVMNIALDKPYDFTDSELRILELLADQAAIAIENANLHGQVRDHVESLEDRVKERTADLEQTINLMAGREVRMAELKSVIKKLHKQLEELGEIPVAKDPLDESIP